MGVRKTRTTAMHPESDGMVERFNSTLGQQMAKFCRDNQASWDEKLPMLVMAYWSAEHEATGYSPARLMTGRELRLPIHVTIGTPPEDDESNTMPEYVDKMKRNLVEVRHHVRTNLKIASGTMKLRFDAKASQTVLEPGEKVWLYNPRKKRGKCPKLSSNWEGPYMIINRLSDVTYRIKGEGRSKAKVVYFNRLWKMHDPKFTWTRGSGDTVDGSTPTTSTPGVNDDADAAQAIDGDDSLEIIEIETEKEIIEIEDEGSDDTPTMICADEPVTEQGPEGVSVGGTDSGEPAEDGPGHDFDATQMVSSDELIRREREDGDSDDTSVVALADGAVLGETIDVIAEGRDSDEPAEGRDVATGELDPGEPVTSGGEETAVMPNPIGGPNSDNRRSNRVRRPPPWQADYVMDL